MRPKPPSPAEGDAFRQHIERYVQKNGYQEAALYLRFFLHAPVTEFGLSEACLFMNMHEFSGLSMFKPYAYFDNCWLIFMSSAVPHDLLPFDMACEIAEVLDKEESKKIEDGMYFHDERISKDAPSRAFALELCLPTPFMKYFAWRKSDFYEICLLAKLYEDVVQERLELPNLSDDAINHVVCDYEAYSGKKIEFDLTDIVWFQRK